MSTIKEASLKQNLGDCEDVDTISQLPDELLLKVLLFLPTKIAASTSILSKRWEFLWMWLPKLEYVHSNDSVPELASLRSFIYLNLPLHKAQVIESFRLKLRKERTWPRIVKPEYITTWVVIVVSRCVRELNLNISCMRKPTSLPSSLYTCKSLVILKLKDQILVAVLPRMACLPSLKTLFLRRVDYSYESSLQELLSICPVLENLFVERAGLEEYSRYFKTLSVIVPSLLRLTLKISRGSQFDELVIDTPSLKYFKITDYKGEYETEGSDDSYSFNFKDMPNLEEADIISTYPDIDKFVRSITSVKRLSLCVRVNVEEALYNEGIFFNQLENLKLCPCDSNWSKLLVRLLKDSPNLRELDVSLNDDHINSCVGPPVCWENQLNCVPECLLSTLGNFKWTGIHGSPKVMDLAKYILRNARCLKTATILFQSALETEDEREIMIQELLLSFRVGKRWEELFQMLRERQDVLLPLIHARRDIVKERKKKIKKEYVHSYVDTLSDLELPDEKMKLNELRSRGVAMDHSEPGKNSGNICLRLLVCTYNEKSLV